MALPSAIGATIKNSVTQLNTLLNSSTWVLLAPTTVDNNNNVNMATANDGTITNNTGAEVEFEGQIAFMQYPNEVNERVQYAIGLYNGSSWSIVSSDLQDIAHGSSWYFTSYNYKVSVPAGYKVGLLMKASAACWQYSYWYMHFSRSLDGGESPSLAVACSTVSNSYALLSTVHTGYTAMRPTTSEYSGAVGGSSSNLRITNTSGGTITVDGWFLDIQYFDGLIAASFQSTALKNGTALGVNTIVTDLSLSSGIDLKCVEVYYSATLANNDYIDLGMKNSAGGTYDTLHFSMQHLMRARE
jgi:hypothetical protein